MKNIFISFLNQPKKVIGVSLTAAIIIGVAGYWQINKTATGIYTDTESLTQALTASSTKNISLGFLSAGRINLVSVKVGDKVKKGDVLASLDAGNASGLLVQAKAAYETANANYQKIVNGATGTAVDVARAAVNVAKVNLDEVTKQQGILVDNAYRTLLNSSLQAQSVSDFGANDAPTVSGTYGCKNEGTYTLKTYSSSGGISVNYSGLEAGTLFITDVPRPLGTCGLFLSFDKTKQLLASVEFSVDIPNKNAANYNANNSAYQLALQTKNQAIALAQASFDQANASLTALVSTARPEDVAAAQAQVDSASGALQIARATYENTIIVAPGDGVVTAVYVSQGQIAVPNTPAMEFTGSVNQ